MKFPLVGTGERLTLADYQAVADRYGVPVAHVRAVAKVEAAGSGWSNDNLIKALYEGHVMYRVASGAIRRRLVNVGLAWRKWTRTRYRKGTRAQHQQVQRAVSIAGDRGYMAASWGLGQVLGENFKMCGFDNAGTMVRYNLRGEAEQLDTMVRFCRGAKLLPALQAGQWAKFARRYNGPGYRKNRYDTKLAAAARLYSKSQAAGLDGNLDTSKSGADPVVRSVQAALNALFAAGLVVDGLTGPATSRAVPEFQKGHPDLSNDGLIGPHTLAAIERALEFRKVKKTEEAIPEKVPTAAGVSAAATGAGAIALDALPWQVGVAIGIAGVVLVGGVVAWRAWRRRKFDQEIEHDKNHAAGASVTVEPWADRQPEFKR